MPKVEFTIKLNDLDPPNRAGWTVSHGDHWEGLTVTNGKAVHDFPEGTKRFVLSVDMEGPVGATAEATMVQKLVGAADKPVKPDFARKIKRGEANSPVRDFQVERL